MQSFIAQPSLDQQLQRGAESAPPPSSEVPPNAW